MLTVGILITLLMFSFFDDLYAILVKDDHFVGKTSISMPCTNSAPSCSGCTSRKCEALFRNGKNCFFRVGIKITMLVSLQSLTTGMYEILVSHLFIAALALSFTGF